MPPLYELPAARTGHLDSAYLGGVTVFVEAEFDCWVLAQRWFYRDQLLHFKAVAPDGGGWAAVVSRVRDAAAGGDLMVFGLVDRDALRAEHEQLFLEPDDAHFRSTASQALNPHVRCLLRWELESYLWLNLARLDGLLTNFSKRRRKAADHGYGPPRNSAEVAEELTAQGSILGPILAANLQLQRHGQRELDGSACHADVPDQAAMKQLVLQRLHERWPDHVVAEPSVALDARQAQLACFDEPGASQPTRWIRMSRLVDPKLLFRRIHHVAQLTLDEQAFFRELVQPTPPPEILDEIDCYLEEFRSVARDASGGGSARRST